jgi:hypothetical protein
MSAPRNQHSKFTVEVFWCESQQSLHARIVFISCKLSNGSLDKGSQAQSPVMTSAGRMEKSPPMRDESIASKSFEIDKGRSAIGRTIESFRVVTQASLSLRSFDGSSPRRFSFV